MPSKIDVFVMASSTAAAIEPIASVATKDGIRTYATATPFARPAIAAVASVTVIAAHTGQPRNAIAPTPAAAARPTTNPTDRSNSPITSTAVTPTARTTSTDVSSR